MEQGGLIRSSVDSSISKDLFLKGKTAYFFTGPWNLSDIRKTPGLKIAISAFPDLGSGCKSVPFLGVQGFMVTSSPPRTASTASPRTSSATT